MKARLMPLYRRSPMWFQTMMASGYGWYLNSWRYGPETERLVQASLDRETWSADRLRAWQDERLAEILERAATKVPYYRDAWARRRAEGDASHWSDLHAWPVLTKDALRSNPSAFVADGVDQRKLFRIASSGTSGTPITTWRSREAMRSWYALFEARWRRWYGVSRHDRWAILGGQEVVNVERTTPPFWVWNAPMGQLYMSTLHLEPANVAAYLEALRRYRIVYLYAYSSSMFALARMTEEQGLSAPQLAAVVSNAEPLLPIQRATLQRVFRAPVFESYGMSEAVAGASECREGHLHLWPEAGIAEVLDVTTDTPLRAGETGRFVFTGLLNRDMPLVRYEVGDRGALAPTDEPCGCGRTLPRIQAIEGRTTDNILTESGRTVFYVGTIFYDMPVKEGQVVQDSLRSFTLNVVPADGFDVTAEQELKNRLIRRVGAVDVEVRLVTEIPRGPNGKFRGVVSRVRGPTA